MNKFCKYFLKALTWTLASWLAALISLFLSWDTTAGVAAMLLAAFVVFCVSPVCFPIYMLHEWAWEPEDKE